MAKEPTRYRYVGPAEILAVVRPGCAGLPIRSSGELSGWLLSRDTGERTEPFTFVIDLAGVLRLAPQRSEHVACAGGEPVLSAGEIRFEHHGGQSAVMEISNQSTGYCPDVTSW